MTDRILAVNFSTLIDKTLPRLFEHGRFPQAFSKGIRHNVLALMKVVPEIRLQSKNM